MADRMIVLGGGVIGLATAFELRQRGLEVAVLEIKSFGGQASGAAAGMLAPYSEIGEDPDDFFRLCLSSLRLFPKWQADVKKASGLEFEYTESGSLHCVYHEADLLSLSSRQGWQKEFGVEATILNQSATQKLEPELSGEVIGAIHYPEESHVYAPDYVKALEKACERSGVELYDHLEHIKLEEWESGIRLTSKSGQEFEADQLVISSGAWAKEYEDVFSLNFPIYPIRGQICAYQLVPERIKHILYSSQGYLVSKADGTLVNGASEDIAGFETTVTEKGINRLTNWNHHMLPFLQELKPFHQWAGLRPATQDGYPLIGRLQQANRVIFYPGHYRNGILLSAATAKAVADLAVRQLPFISLDRFEPERFS
ncbi:glycine oxidase ThiO [Alkalicoccobacillus plakortidis]|uniref:glycine oxidase n=1 Tax=Alkalicoccobacillus plakortidis TaxID=444060 RepID=A0ABT0XR96_9BACI|nr:glycine oxidase ThiO [Alkalicoccobacillus plakortidis]MCM2677789.1 glycine oxidase ThiO [Alkalicoccobacillus plakortidis]